MLVFDQLQKTKTLIPVLLFSMLYCTERGVTLDQAALGCFLGYIRRQNLVLSNISYPPAAVAQKRGGPREMAHP